MADESIPVLQKEDVVKMYKKFDPEMCYISITGIPEGAWSFSDVIFKAYEEEAYKKNLRDELREVKTGDSETSESSTGDRDLIDFDSDEVTEAVQRLNNCLERKNRHQLNSIFSMKNLPEKDLLVALGVHLIRKLSGKCFTNRSKAGNSCPCGCGEKLTSTAMCIGTERTWHGELDLLAGNEAIPMNATNVGIVRPTEANLDDTQELQTEEAVEQEDDASSSQGDRTDLEIKTENIYSGLALCQILAETIVFSWTEYNRHLDYSPCIPSVLMANGKFAAFVYNSVNDELYATTGYVHLSSKNQIVGIFSLWVFLNHHLFFRKKKQTALSKVCGFRSSLSSSLLKQYEELKEYKKQIVVWKDPNEFCLSPRMYCIKE